MSQITKTLTSGGPIPPAIPTSFNTQNGTAVPLANVLIINGFDSVENNDNGIITKGGVVGTGTQNEVDVVLTNRATNQITTTDATITTIITLPLTNNFVYSIQGTVTLRVQSTGDGASYDFYSGMKSVASIATEIGTEYPTTFEDASLVTADIFLVVDGANNVLLQVQGVAGLTIHWDAVLTYRQVT